MAEETKKAEETKNPADGKALAGKEESVVIPEKFKKLVEEIERLSVLDLAELVKVLEKKFGVSAQAPVMMAPAAQSAAGPAVEEKTIFTIVLKEVGDKKIEVIKAVRDLSGKGLKEAKDFVDSIVTGPQTLKEGVKKEEAEELKKKFETAGAKIELK